MKSFLAAVAFLTRVPLGRLFRFGREQVAGSAGWFSLVGAMIGTGYAALAASLDNRLPHPVIAVLLVGMEALLTGALHLDALADTADAFGGGHTRDEVLRIMRDHAIGSYGATALILLIALKMTAYHGLLEVRLATIPLILAPALGRWSILPLSYILPYARESAAVRVGRGGVVWGTVTVAGILGLVPSLRGLVSAVAVMLVTLLFGRYCRRRIGGVTGDTLGANVQFCESAVLLTFLWSRTS